MHAVIYLFCIENYSEKPKGDQGHELRNRKYHGSYNHNIYRTVTNRINELNERTEVNIYHKSGTEVGLA